MQERPSTRQATRQTTRQAPLPRARQHKKKEIRPCQAKARKHQPPRKRDAVQTKRHGESWRRRTDFGKERTVESFTERLSAEMAGKSPCRVNVRVGQPTPLPLPALADSPGLPYGRWYKTGTGPVVARESRATARACREGRRLA